jgi:leader peptidase (prepilin peptidase) / N-methyltransferase
MPIDNAVWTTFWGVMAFTWGACIGSFLNVCIYRIPADLSVVTPRSRCPHCRVPIAWYDNIPLLSYLVLRARCRRCGAPIAMRYFLVEGLTGILFLAVWLKFGFTDGPRLMGLAPVTDLGLIPVYWLVVAALVMATFIDLDHMIIPDRVSIGGIVAGLVLSAAVPALHGAAAWSGGLLRSAVGAAVGFFALWAVALFGRFLFKKEAMGFGDVKLLGALGAFFGVRAVFFIIMMSSLVGSIIGVALIATRRKGLQTRIPYGPFLAVAALLWLLWGPIWWDWYLSLILPDPLG